MNWNNLEAAWQRQVPPLPTSAQVGPLVRECAARQKRIDQFLFWSDFRGSLVSFGLAAYLGQLAWKRGGEYWPIGIAAALLLGLGWFLAAEGNRARRSRVSPATSMVAMLDADLAVLRRRRGLLRHVAVWLLLPMTLCLGLVLAVAAARHPGAFSDPRWGAYGASVVLIMGITWFINQRYARTRIEPQIDALERLRHGLLAKNP